MVVILLLFYSLCNIEILNHKSMKKHNREKCFLFFVFFVLATFVGRSDDLLIENGHWKLTYVENEKYFKLHYRNLDGTYKAVIMNFTPEATYEHTGGETQTVSSSSFSQMDYAVSEIDDSFGQGVCYSFTFSQPESGDDVDLTQNFYFYEGHDYLLTQVVLSGESDILSNYLAPVVTRSAYNLFVSGADNRMLKVPFDNDGFVRFQRYSINGEMTSYEVSAIYQGESRNGLVLGSVDHDHWKSAVYVKGSGNGKLEQLKLFSGVSTSETRDVLPHGKLNGPDISSARMFVGYFNDWREGMEQFGKANTLVQPIRDTWTGGTPFGWQSWGVMVNKNSYQTDIEISDYFHDVLKPAGFCNDQGLNIISMDAGDNLNTTQQMNLIKHAEENGQIVGGYSTPFALWWGDNDLDNLLYTAPDGTKYTARDCILKVNGEPYKLDGAYCLDPTHPATKSGIASQMRVMKAKGFKYVKLDFTSNGIVQADSYFNPQVKTAVEAYNEGFSYLIKKANEGEPLFIALSISPIFPYQYGNSRRIACDTWGTIGQTEYSMNALSGGWWINELYQYNDPDHLVFIGNNDQGSATLGENRARMTNGAICGMMLVADNFSLTDQSGQGNAVLSRSRAETVLMNRDVNEMGNLGRSFRPVYGYKEYNGQSDGAESFFTYQTEDYLYVAIINYKQYELVGDMGWADLGINAQDIQSVKELWTSQMVDVSNGRLSYNVPGCDARIYRICLKLGVDVDEASSNANTFTIDKIGSDKLMISSSKPMRSVEAFNLQGYCISMMNAEKMNTGILHVPDNKVVMLRTCFCDGQTRTDKLYMN